MQTGGLKTNIVSMSIIIVIVICTLFQIQCLEALLHRIFHNKIMINDNNDVRYKIYNSFVHVLQDHRQEIKCLVLYYPWFDAASILIICRMIFWSATGHIIQFGQSECSSVMKWSYTFSLQLK